MIRPLRDQVLLCRDRDEDVTPGGIIKPDTAKRKRFRGIVVAFGPDADAELTVGERVLFETQPGGVDVKEDGTDYTLVPLDQILAVLEGSEGPE